MGENGKWRNRIIERRRVRVGDLAENKWNPKTHPVSQQARIEAVLDRFGVVEDLIAYYSERNGGALTIFDGHARQKLDPDQEWDVVVTDLTDQEVDELVFYFDPLAGMSRHDEAKMTALMQDLGDVDGVLGEMLAELAEGVGLAFGSSDGPEDPGPQIDRAAELQEVWQVKRGQIWEIPSHSVPGKAHRLMCGDSTCAEDVGRLMEGKKARLMATDPPYGVAYHDETGSGRGDTILNDENDGPRLQAFLESCFVAWLPHLEDNAAWYLWHAQLTQGFFAAAAAAAAADILIHRQIIWVKPSLIMGHGDYHWQHELCFYGWRRGNRPPFYGPRNQSTIWMVGRQNETPHPTEKPVELWYAPMENHLVSGEVAAEPFTGGGSQFVAGEQLGRLVYGAEIEPKYCSVTLDRLQRLGLEPRLVEGDLQHF